MREKGVILGAEYRFILTTELEKNMEQYIY